MTDVADQLGIPVNTAWNRLRLGRDDLRASVGEAVLAAQAPGRARPAPAARRASTVGRRVDSVERRAPRLDLARRSQDRGPRRPPKLVPVGLKVPVPGALSAGAITTAPASRLSCSPRWILRREGPPRRRPCRPRASPSRQRRSGAGAEPTCATRASRRRAANVRSAADGGRCARSAVAACAAPLGAAVASAVPAPPKRPCSIR